MADTVDPDNMGHIEPYSLDKYTLSAKMFFFWSAELKGLTQNFKVSI